MNILILCSSNGLGGLELYAERERQSLQSRGNTCYLSVQENSPLSNRLKLNKERCLLTRPHWKVLPLITAIKLARYIDANEIDLIHIHWTNDITLGVLTKFFSKRIPKLVYSRHMGITRPKKDFYHRFFYSRVDHLLVVSKQVEKEAHKHLPLPPHRISLLYLGVPATDNPAPVQHSSLLPDKFVGHPFRIGMFGRIEHGKGQHLLIEAMTVLVNDGFDGGAMITGQVMNEEYFNQLKKSVADAGISDNISFEGFTRHPLLAMSSCDVVVLLTYCETFGLVLVEAMRQGVAVIGTNAGGVPEIITDNHTGLLIPPGNSAALAVSLRSLYENEALRQQLATNGKIKADEAFDEDVHFDKLNKILCEVREQPPVPTINFN